MSAVDTARTTVGGPLPPADVAESTRLLCAAAYADQGFAKKVVDAVVADRHHAVPPEFGLEVRPVVRHCLAAVHRVFLRELYLVAVIVLNVLLAALTDVTALGSIARALLLGWAGIVVFECLKRFQVLPAMARQAFRPEAAPVPLPDEEAALHEYAEQSRGNVSVYSGFSPFVGAGVGLRNWSFTTDLQRGKQAGDGTTRAPRPFRLDELYDSVRAALLDLGIPRLEISSRLFVNGQDLRTEQWLLPDEHGRPAVVAGPERIMRYACLPDDRVRHYLVIQVPGWHGEMVVTVFLRFALTRSDLFTEASSWVLPPLRDAYHRLDADNPVPDLRSACRIFVSTLLMTIPRLITAPFTVLGRLWEGLFGGMSERALRRRITADATYDFGATRSIREEGMAPEYRRYFQRSDREMHVKQIEYRFFDALTGFLDRHDISTLDARANRVTVINSGLMMSGGSLRADSLAVGRGAQAVKILRKVTRRSSEPDGSDP